MGWVPAEVQEDNGGARRRRNEGAGTWDKVDVSEESLALDPMRDCKAGYLSSQSCMSVWRWLQGTGDFRVEEDALHIGCRDS